MGREGAKRVVKAVETTMSDIADYKWATTKDELLTEMEKRFATKTDLALLRADMALLQTKLESKMLLYFLILIFVIILTNSRALDLLYKLLGLVR
ncbi:MAG: hypothetical protein HQL03_08620 [Nitrospirae bacterium]|nr:hypothetical protein [Nitrospirota bacterium]MBF0592626.1 hypothetical protein [Nitrospirota bacterium]